MGCHDAIVNLCREYGVERQVSGSAADGRFDPDRSDFDFIATFADKDRRIVDRSFGFIDALEALLGRHVDLLAESPFATRTCAGRSMRVRRDLYVKPN